MCGIPGLHNAFCLIFITVLFLWVKGIYSLDTSTSAMNFFTFAMCLDPRKVKRLSHASGIWLYLTCFQPLRAILDGGQWTYPFPVLGLCHVGYPFSSLPCAPWGLATKGLCVLCLVSSGCGSTGCCSHWARCASSNSIWLGEPKIGFGHILGRGCGGSPAVARRWGLVRRRLAPGFVKVYFYMYMYVVIFMCLVFEAASSG
jgi:hypothetical protein